LADKPVTQIIWGLGYITAGYGSPWARSQAVGSYWAGSFGGEPAVIQSVSPDGTTVVVTSPAGDGSVEVTLTLAGGSTVTADEDFVYVEPVVSDVSPRSGPTAGGTTVTIVGEGLGGTTGVLFGDTPGTIVGTPPTLRSSSSPPPARPGRSMSRCSFPVV